LDAQRMSARTCPKRFGKHGVCGAVLVSDTVAGSLVVSCPACERFARGICRDCPAPVDGKPRHARRCAPCKAKALRAMHDKYVENNHDLVTRRAREYGRQHRQQRADYKRLWRQANPDKVRAQKARGTQRADYMAEYRWTHRVRLANAARAKRQGAQKLRTCIACRRVVVTHRKRKCTRCKAQSLEMARARLAGRAA
jgi:hypothetical protein